jgi:hypothetical protein
MKKKFIFIFFLLTIPLAAKFDTSYVSINFDKNLRINISPYLFGGFIEYYSCFANGPSGIYAQELLNRGFDINDTIRNVSPGWNNWIDSYPEESKWEILNGGFNENGIFYQRIIRKISDGFSGIYQRIFTSKNQGYIFYTYLKGDTTIIDVKMKIMDKDMKCFFPLKTDHNSR